MKSYKDGNEVLCTTYIKANLIYDLETNQATSLDSNKTLESGNKSGKGLASFTEIFYYDWFDEDRSDFTGEYVFDERYKIFQQITSDYYAGFTIAPIMVDVMFQIVTINERKIIEYQV